jgi:hypothetical protein
MTVLALQLERQPAAYCHGDLLGHATQAEQISQGFTFLGLNVR